MLKNVTILLIGVLLMYLNCGEQTINLEKLQFNIQKLISKSSGTISVAFEDLKTGRKLFINEKIQMHAASTMKTPVMIEIFKQAYEGKFNLTDSLIINNEFSSIVDGSKFSMNFMEDSDDFVYKNTNGKINVKSISKANQIFIILPLAVILIMSVLVLLFQFFNNREREYSFDFYDSYTKEIIKNNRCEIKLLSDNESPIHYLSDSTGRVVLKTNKSVVTMLISAPYYKSDTIIRILKKFDRAQKISLQINDYALILHYFSEMNVDDWQKRRDYLVEIIDNGAIFYQVLNDKNKQGMALYNKTEFIDKLTMPTGSLKFIEILDTKFKNDKIVLVRFRINKLSK